MNCFCRCAAVRPVGCYDNDTGVSMVIKAVPPASKTVVILHFFRYFAGECSEVRTHQTRHDAVAEGSPLDRRRVQKYVDTRWAQRETLLL